MKRPQTQAIADHSGQPSRLFKSALLILMGVVGLWFVATAFLVPFLGDDWRYIYEIENATSPFGYLTDPYTTSFSWRPVTDFVWVVNYCMFHHSAVGYHLTNVIIFFATAYLLYITVRQIASQRTALLAAFFFMLIPTNYENIIWVSGRTDSLALFFGLLTILFYIYYRRGKGTHHLALSLFAYALSLYSKESAVLVPAVLLLIDILYYHADAFGMQAGSVPRGAVAYMKRYWIYLIFGAVVILFLISRSLIIGDVVSRNTGFTSALSLLPTWETFKTLLNISSIQVNFSVLNEVSPWLRSLWGQFHTWIMVFFLLLLGATQLPHIRERKFWRQFILALSIMALFILPVHFLIGNITNELKHIRLFYAYSAGDALLLATLFGYNHLTGWIKHARTALFVVLVAFFLFALGVNAVPWIRAGNATEQIVEQLGEQYPDLTEAQHPVTAYLLNIPGQVNGAYIYHDYLSLHQAMRMAYPNPMLSIHATGGHAVEPAPLCTPEDDGTVRAFSWKDRGVYSEKPVVAERWNEQPKVGELRWQGYNEIMKSGWFVQDAEIEKDDAGDLVLHGFGNEPRLYVDLPGGAHTRDWLRLTLAVHDADSGDPVQLLFLWKTGSIGEFTAFNQILLEGELTEPVELCAYPNWIVAGDITSVALQFPSGYDGRIRVHEIALIR